jgi:hypothetical protein
MCQSEICLLPTGWIRPPGLVLTVTPVLDPLSIIELEKLKQERSLSVKALIHLSNLSPI